MAEAFEIEIDLELLAEFVDEAHEELAGLEPLFLELETNPGDVKIVEGIFRPVHTIKGNSAFFGLMKVKHLAHELENLLSLAKEGKMVPGPDTISIWLEGIDWLKGMLEKARNGEAEVEDEGAYSGFVERVVQAGRANADTSGLVAEIMQGFEKAKESLAGVEGAGVGGLDKIYKQLMRLQSFTGGATDKEQVKGEHSADKPKEDSAADGKKAAGGDGARQQGGEKQAAKTMRIAEESIDRFFDYVGELVVVGEMYTYLHRKFVEDLGNSPAGLKLSQNMRRVNETFISLSDNLQRSVLDIRKVPAKNLLQKVPRMVRDIASAAGKAVRVELFGEDVLIDKSIMETLDGPLTHMARNSADHGIEKPEGRKAAGKEAEGVVRVGIEQTADNLVLVVEDDGKGLDEDALKAKAVKLGLISEGEQLGQEQIVELIFASGVSTAEQVTDVSGRGVGMDVVKRSIEQAKGRINVKNEKGKGCRFSITLPKTISTQIIDGFLVQIGESIYVIPLERISETFGLDEGMLKTVTGRGLSVLKHDRIFPVVRLQELFGEKCGLSEENSKEGQIMVVAQAGRQYFALAVDAAVGTQKVVLKELENINISSNIFSGAAIMGDGSVALVLDVDQIGGSLSGRD
jgi:two-component system, chemotaxis family, sensor kinase CheA